MARTTLPKTIAPGPDPTAGVVVTMTAADVANGNQFAWTGQELVNIQNTHATNAYTYSFISRADERGRTGDIATQSIAAGAIHVVDCLSSAGWRQTDGYVYVNGSNAAVLFGVITTKGRAS